MWVGMIIELPTAVPLSNAYRSGNDKTVARPFVRLEDAIRHHLDPYTSARSYLPSRLPLDLQGQPGPTEPVLARLDPLLQTPIVLSDEEFSNLVDFVNTVCLTRVSCLNA
jgi:hypothetical protein